MDAAGASVHCTQVFAVERQTYGWLASKIDKKMTPLFIQNETFQVPAHKFGI